ncbi:hypothetical protein Hanom_Chr05g00454001 [Helianthus anomalus]
MKQMGHKHTKNRFCMIFMRCHFVYTTENLHNIVSIRPKKLPSIYRSKYLKFHIYPFH